jgi:glutamyl-tRNA synthetase
MTEIAQKIRTRLAPTPSGALHLGNAFSFLCAWTWARSQGGEVVLRIEDVDTTRRRPEWIESVFRDLEWLGLDWDFGPTGVADEQGPWFQSSAQRQERYAQLWEEGKRSGAFYPCQCTRKEIRSDAPQVDHMGEAFPQGVRYAGRCRARYAAHAGPRDAWRWRLPEVLPAVREVWANPVPPEWYGWEGDPIVRRGDGCTAYHLAVCADDVDQGITHIVRGRDLQVYAPLHQSLQTLAGARHPTVFAHHPLLGAADGTRLAKRIGSRSLTGLREAGVDAREVVSALGRLLYPEWGETSSLFTARELVHMGIPNPGTHDKICPEIQVQESL